MPPRTRVAYIGDIKNLQGDGPGQFAAGNDARLAGAVSVLAGATPAVGNGSAADAAAINATIAAAPVGSTVVFPGPRTYLADATILLRGGRNYVFADGALIKQKNGANLDAVVASPAALTTGAGQVFDAPMRITGLRVDGNFANQTGGAGHGIVIAAGGDNMARRTELVDVAAVNTRGDGVVLTETNWDGNTLGFAGGTGATTAVEPRLIRVRAFFTCGRGIWVKHGPSNTLTDGWAVDCVTGYTRHDGIRIDSAAGWKIDNPHVYAAGLSGLVIQNSYATRVRDPYIEGIGALDTASRTGSISTFSAAPAWDSGTSFGYYDVTTYNAVIYISKVAGNVGNTPDVSPSQWTPYFTQGTTVGALVAWDCGSGRPTLIEGAQASLGHASWTLQSAWSYRGMILKGPASGSARGTVFLGRNDVVNELQPAGANTIAYRLIAGTGGLRVIEPATNAGRGSWTQQRSVDAAVAPTGAVGAAGSGGTGAAITVTGSDQSGTVSVTTGSSGMTTGALATVSFSTSKSGGAPAVSITPKNAAAAALQPFATASSSAVSVNVGVAPATATTYVFDYVVEGS